MKQIEGPEGQRTGHAPGTAIPEAWQYLDLLRRRWWIIAAGGALALGAAWWGERGTIPVYTAEVLLEQQREAPLVGIGGGGGASDFASQVETIRSRAVIADVVDALGLQLRILDDRAGERSRAIEAVQANPEARGGPYTLTRSGNRIHLLTGTEEARDTIATVGADEEWIEGPDFRIRLGDRDTLAEEPIRFILQDRQAAVERFRGQIRVEPGRARAMVRVSYTNPDPEMAAAVVNGMASAYQGYRARRGREAATRRREVIANQLAGLADSLQAAQAAVVEYQRTQPLLDPGYEGSQLMSAVVSTETDLRTLRFQERILSSVVAGLRSEGGMDDSLNRILALGDDLVPGGPALHRRLQELQTTRAQLTVSRFGRLEGDPEVEVVDSLITSTKQQIRIAAEHGLEHLKDRLEGAEERLADARGNMVAIPGQTAELARLRQRADAVQEVVDALVDGYYEAQIAEAVEVGDVSVVDPAIVPLSPDRQQARMRLLFGLAAGLMVGVVGALALEYFDMRIRRVTDVETVTGLPLLAMIPKTTQGWGSRNAVGQAVAKEAFRSLRTNLNFSQPVEPRVLAVTSATPREGKTTVAINLAAALAEQEDAQRVLLVDADLRRPQVHNVFGMEQGPGLTDLMAGKVELEDAVRPSPLHPRLHVLCAGNRIGSPSELIGRKAFPNLIHHLREHFDFVVIDTPPLLAVTDGAVIAKAAEGTLMVVRANEADRVALSAAVEQLRRINVSVLGVILNAAGTWGGEGRYYYAKYDDYLGGSDSPGRKPTRGKREIVVSGSDRG